MKVIIVLAMLWASQPAGMYVDHDGSVKRLPAGMYVDPDGNLQRLGACPKGQHKHNQESRYTTALPPSLSHPDVEPILSILPGDELCHDDNTEKIVRPSKPA
jgi:hypothetical protein